MKKKGFTLIELLAVIVILAIIALIATPTILGVIEKSRKGAFEQTVNGIVRSAEVYRAKEEITNPLTGCRYFSFGNDVAEITTRGEKVYYPVKDLNVKGTLPTEGEAKVCSDIIVVEVSDGNYSGRYDGQTTNVSKGDLASNDLTTPVIDNINTTLFSDKIIVTVNAHSESAGGIIAKYYYKINDGNYVETTEKSYIFDKLNPDTEYTVYVKVENKSGITKEESKTVTTKALGQLAINVSNEIEWTTSKTITLEGTQAIEYQVFRDGETNDTWLEYSEPFVVDEEATATNMIIINARYKGVEDIVTKFVSTIDVSNPTLEITSTEKTTNSLSLNYTAADAESDIKETICEFKIGEETQQATGSNGKCTITGLSEGTVEYKVTTKNNAGLSITVPESGYSSIAIEEVALPTILVNTTPETATDGYVTSASATIEYTGSTIANPVYYARTTRATISNKEAVATCELNSETNEITCTDITPTTSLSSETWYKFNENPTFTYSTPATEEATLYVIISDGTNISQYATATIHKIFYKSADISYTNDAVSSVTNVEQALDYLYDNLK